MKSTNTARRPAGLRDERAIHYIALDKIQAYANNPKLHKEEQIRLLVINITQFGFTNPVLVDEKMVLIAGHARVQAARRLGLTKVPAIIIRGLTSAQKKSLRISDNRLAEVGTSWSIDLLELEITTIQSLEPDFNFEDLGFTSEWLDSARSKGGALPSPADDVIPHVPAQAVTRLGDIWTIGEHRLVCGDATAATTYAALLGRDRAAMVFADPPYNVKINGNVSGLGRNKHREFVQGSGEMSDEEFQRFLVAFMLLCRRFTMAGALHYVCMDWRGLPQLLLAGSGAYDEQINLCVWAKTNAGMGSLYRSQHELIAVFKAGKASHRNNVKLGSNGRHRSNVWNYPGMTIPSKERDEALALHPTCKPVALVQDAILDVTERGDIVLDPFGGSGTTLIAAHRAGRLARLIELDPLYCDVILQRSSNLLSITPILAETGETYDEVTTRRAAEVQHG